eukprot:gene3887-7100_t
MNSLSDDVFFYTLEFLEYRQTQKLKLLSKETHQKITEHHKEISKKFSSSLKHNETVQKIFIDYFIENQELFGCFPLDSFLIHEHHLTLDKQYCYFPGATELMMHLHFSYKLNEHHFEVKIFEDFSETASGDGGANCYLIHSTIAGFSSLNKYCFAEKTDFQAKVVGTFQNEDISIIKNSMGFVELDDEKFVKMIRGLILISDIEDISLKKLTQRDYSPLPEDLFDNIEKSKLICIFQTQTVLVDGKNKSMVNKVNDYKKKTFNWINDWMSEIPDFDDFEEDKNSDFPNFLGDIISGRASKLTLEGSFEQFKKLTKF